MKNVRHRQEKFAGQRPAFYHCATQHCQQYRTYKCSSLANGLDAIGQLYNRLHDDINTLLQPPILVQDNSLNS